jgi:hypothetical protein
MKRYAVVGMLLAFAVSANAQASRPLAGAGVGAAPCSLFNEILSKNPKWTEDTYTSWADGYLAGSNYERWSNKQPTVIVNFKSADERWAYLKKHCEDHPSDRFVVGVMALQLLLPTKPHED